MRRLARAAAVGAAALLTLAAAPAPIVGWYETADGSAAVQIARCGETICGRIGRLLTVDPSKPSTDVNNPDPALRKRPIVGLPILTGFTPGEDEWNGSLYDPRSGRTYRATLVRRGSALKVKACLGPFCRTQTWAHGG